MESTKFNNQEAELGFQGNVYISRKDGPDPIRKEVEVMTVLEDPSVQTFQIAAYDRTHRNDKLSQ
jgi:hypothetical protein